MARDIRSLGDVKGLLHMHGHSIGRTVRLKCLWRIRHARKMRTLLRQQIDGMGWEVEGIEHLNALVRVHRRTGLPPPPPLSWTRSSPTSSSRPRAPARMMTLEPPPLAPSSHPLTPSSPGLADIVRLAEQMMEAGTSLPHQPVPPNLVDLAGRVLNDQAHPHEDGTAEDDGGGLELPLTARLLDAGTKLRRLHLGSVAIEEIVHLLGELLENVATVIITEWHPRPTYDDGLPSPSQVAAGPGVGSEDSGREILTVLSKPVCC